MTLTIIASLLIGVSTALFTLYGYPSFQKYISASTEKRLRNLLPGIESAKARDEIAWLVSASPWLSLGVLIVVLLFARSAVSIMVGIVVVYFVYRGPNVWKKRMHRLQNERLLVQLPDALNAVANGLRAGETLPLAFKHVGSKFDKPVASVFHVVSARNDAGERFEDSLLTVFNSLRIEAFDYTARAIAIHVRRGGPAYDLLSEIRSIVIEQDRCDRVIRATTAAGRFTMRFLVWSPVLVLPFLLIMQPDFAELLLSNAFGIICTVFAVSMYLFARYWAKQILTVEKL